MEGCSDRQELVGKANLSLSERNSALVQTNGSFDLAKLGVEAVERSGRSCHNQVSGAIKERDADVAVFGQVLVSRINVLLKLSLRKIPNAKHGSGSTLAVVLWLTKHIRSPAQPPDQIQSNKLPNKSIKYAKILFQSNKYKILDLK
jgi:hypothetical protein